MRCDSKTAAQGSGNVHKKPGDHLCKKRDAHRGRHRCICGRSWS